MKKVLTFVLFIALAFAVNAQTAGAGPLVICGAGESAGESCAPDYNGHFSSGIVPYAPDVNSEYFPIIRACEPLDLCITMHCPASINLSAVGLGNNTINLRGIEVKGFGGLPNGISYCLSNANWVPDGYYTIHLWGTPMQAGTYQLKLSAVLSGGTFLSVNTDLVYPNGMDAIQVTVQEATPLVAGFTADATEITAGCSVNFTNTSTGYQTSRTWTFEGGNPATSTEENPTVTYSTPGTYRVSLTITNACDDEDTKTETSYITVSAPELSADFSADFTSVAAGNTVNYTNNSIINSCDNDIHYAWTFEGGTPETSTEENPSVVYCTPGTHNVSLTISNSDGENTKNRNITVTENPLVADFTASTTEIEAGNYVNFTNTSTGIDINSNVTYEWTFEGGTPETSTEQNPRVLYSVQESYPASLAVSLKVTTPCDSKTKTIQGYITVTEPVNVVAPVANFICDSAIVEVGGSVHFTDISRNLPETRQWTFAGGTPETSTEQNPVVTYSEKGTFAVKLVVSNSAGRDSITIENYITVIADPIADFSCNTTEIEVGGSVNFFDRSTNEPTSWQWTFEGGTPETSTEQNPVVTYSEKGTFAVTLVVSNLAGEDAKTETKYISVVTDVEDFAVDNVSVYPNPTSSILNIEAENLVSVTILDMSGRIVYFAAENCSATSIDLSGFANAEYMVKVETSNGSSLKRIIKTR